MKKIYTYVKVENNKNWNSPTTLSVRRHVQYETISKCVHEEIKSSINMGIDCMRQTAK